MDGNRFERAAARGAALPLSATELHRCFGDLWASVKAVECDGLNTLLFQIELLFGKGGYLNSSYRRAGQRGRATRALIRSDAPDPRSALESVVGPVVWFEVEQATEPAVEAEPVNGAISQIDAAAPAAGRVVPFPPSAVKELHQLQCIVGAAERLADLSTRLERARSPPDPSHSANAWRRSGERPSGSEWVTR